MKELHYKYYEDMKLFDPSDEEYELHFSQVPESKRQEFAYVKGKVLSRNVNKKMVRFTEPALQMAVRNFKATPFLEDHDRTMKSVRGTVTNLSLDDNGLNYFSIIPRTRENEHTIQMLQSDVAGVIKTSIGGSTTSITCSICNAEFIDDGVVHRDHRFGKRYDGELAFGNVNDWATKEISLTVFPADTDTSTSVYTTGFSELDDLKYNEQEQKSDTLLNEEINIKSDLHMTEEDVSNGSEPQIKSVTPEVDIEQVASQVSKEFVSKSDFDELKSIMLSLAERQKAQDEAVISAKRLELSELTGEDTEAYAGFSLSAIDKMIGLVRKRDVPEERGQVEGDGRRDHTQQITPEMKKEAARLILGIKPTSQKVVEQYGHYSTGNYTNDLYERVGKELSVKFAENEEGDK